MKPVTTDYVLGDSIYVKQQNSPIMAGSGNDGEEDSLGEMEMFYTLIAVVGTWVGVLTKFIKLHAFLK